MRPKTIRRILAAGLLAVLVLLAGLLVLKSGLHSLDKARYPLKYSEYVEECAEQYGLDPYLLYAFIRTESGFDPSAQSAVDARGLMQITEETFVWIKSKIAPDEEIAFEDLYDPQLNIRFGTYYLAACLERYDGDVATAAAAYHSGWGTVDALLEKGGYSVNGRTLHTFPYEQMGLYVKMISRSYKAYQRIYAQDGTE